MSDAKADPSCPGCRALSKKVVELAEVIVRLEAKVERLEARLRENSSNSHRPPSSDSPWSKGKGDRNKPSGRSPGGQPGHPRHERKPKPPDEVHCVEPSLCECCGGSAFGRGREVARHQVTEIPPVRPLVTEWRVYARRCRSCGHVTRAKLPDDVPRGAFGPRLTAMAVLLTGAYRVSRRNACALLRDAFGVEISLGAISNLEASVANALARPHQAALCSVRRSRVVHSDETGWREANDSSWLWTAVTKKVSAYQIAGSRGSDVAKGLLGKDFRGTNVSDRWSGYRWIDPKQRQVCWAHLLRDFRKIAESGKGARTIGECLEAAGRELFGFWHCVRDGTLSRESFQRHARALRKEIRNLLVLGTQGPVARARSLCRGILEVEPCLWTFARRPGVEPTNNDAERALRPAVIWRKTSMGTQSERGSRYVERVLTCVGTLRRRGRQVLDYLNLAAEAALRGESAPSFTR